MVCRRRYCMLIVKGHSKLGGITTYKYLKQKKLNLPSTTAVSEILSTGRTCFPRLLGLRPNEKDMPIRPKWQNKIFTPVHGVNPRSRRPDPHGHSFII